MRVYVGATSADLRELADTRLLPAGRRGVAVTPQFRESYAVGDAEELEYAALTHAAARSLDLVLAAGETRRVVIACEVPEAAVVPIDDGRPGDVTLAQPVPLADVAALHVDDPEVNLADAEGWELMWFATQELGDLLRTP